jgi:alpha-glucosidase
MAYTFDLLNTPHSADYIREVVARFRDNAGDAWPCWALSNHDVVRSATRWGSAEDASAYPRIALAMLISLRGSVCLYQGEELGLPEAEVPFERIQDPYGIPFWPEFKGRDGCRTPMVWNAGEQGGFSVVEPWLPVDARHLPLSVDEQERQPDSMLHAMRQFISWRQQQPALVRGELELIEDSGEVLSWIRRDPQQTMLVALNLTGQTQRMAWTGPALQLCDQHGFSGRLDGEQILLPAYQALFAEL